MKLIDQLYAAAGIGTNEVVARTIVWNGAEIPMFFRDLPGGEVQRLLKLPESDPEIVAAAVCEEDGTPAITLAQAHTLKLGLRAVIVREAMDVFGFTQKARDEAKKD